MHKQIKQHITGTFCNIHVRIACKFLVLELDLIVLLQIFNELIDLNRLHHTFKIDTKN